MDARRQRIVVTIIIGTLVLATALTLFRVDLRNLVPFAVALACPLVMLSMHRGHARDEAVGAHHHADRGSREEVDR